MPASAIQEALDRLKNPDAQRSNSFPVGTRTFSVQRQKDAMKRRDRAMSRKLIKPENAQPIIDALPVEPGDHMHAIVAGDFVFCDLLTRIAQQLGPAALTVSTLSLSSKNVDALADGIAAGHISSFRLLLSHYFQSTSKEIFTQIEAKLGKCVSVARTHAKVALFDLPDRKLVIEGSANLRSSGNLEQISVFSDPDLYAFHVAWMKEAAR